MHTDSMRNTTMLMFPALKKYNLYMVGEWQRLQQTYKHIDYQVQRIALLSGVDSQEVHQTIKKCFAKPPVIWCGKHFVMM